MNHWNERLNTALKTSGLTQGQLAEALQVSRQTVISWVHGNTPPSLEAVDWILLVEYTICPTCHGSGKRPGGT